ncbi:MAG: ATP-binding protein [Clostridia bacterium]|nr:ATP-binding protein [Clostridia bacterium]
MGKVNRTDNNGYDAVDEKNRRRDEQNTELQANIAECLRLKDEIIKKKKDSKQMSPEEKVEIRKLYNKIFSLAKKITEMATCQETIKIHEKLQKTAAARAREYGSAIVGESPKTKMEDIQGLSNVKELINSFLFMLKNNELVEYYNVEGGCNMLMYGAPGTGKSMFAEAVANEMGLPIYKITPADIFKPYVGESEASVRNLFAELDTCDDGAVLFIDECESIFSVRKADTNEAKEAVTTELLQAMNGFGVDRRKIIIMAATNCPEKIDPAYLRYKRFSHIVHVTPPDTDAIRALIKRKLRVDNTEAKWGKPVPENKKPIKLNTDVTVDYITNELIKRQKYINGYPMFYYTPADINGIIEEACRQALVYIQENKLSEPISLSKEMFNKAFDKVPPSVTREKIQALERFRENNN